MRHTRIQVLFLVYGIIELCGISVKLEPRNMLNKLVPTRRPLRRNVEQPGSGR
jgi:hypothetical protein